MATSASGLLWGSIGAASELSGVLTRQSPSPFGSLTGPFRPPQWRGPAMVSITVQQNATQSQSANGNLTLNSTTTTTYVFDAVFAVDHSQDLQVTEHPVQTGADISSHAYLMPARVVLDIGMSDAMDSYSNGKDPNTPPYITPFSGSSSKSVSAYQQILALQAARVPLTVTTRLRTYKNMVITRISPREDYRTIASLRMQVEFRQIFTASVVTSPNSARPNDTASTGLGSVNPTPPSNATQSQFGVPIVTDDTTLTQDFQNLNTWLNTTPGGVDVPGAGTFSSSNIANLQNLPAPQ